MTDMQIVSDGTSQGTKVKVGDNFVKGVCKIEIDPIIVDGLVTAKITVVSAKLDLGIALTDFIVEDRASAERLKDAINSSRR